ncbi:MAG: SGNH/GDSL hydrolase family protein [Bryobacterales bacterium]|nr:SGNH/GDSL hydrolase family protein [Bryobacterales bacterium]
MRLLALALLLVPAVTPQRGPAPERGQMEREFDAYRRLLLDWGGLTRYGSDNAEVKLDPAVDRVVFLGDELTAQWLPGGAAFFPGKSYLNRGIERQTTAQMLVRFRQDVVALRPKAVVIQGGSNDIASVMGPTTEPAIADNIMSMVELAQVHGIRVVLASVTPVCDCAGVKQSALRPAFKIAGLNGWLRGFAQRSGSIYLDYYSALAEGRTMSRSLTVDGLKPNAAGYARMAALAEQAIAQALAAPLPRATAYQPPPAERVTGPPSATQPRAPGSPAARKPATVRQ